MFNKNIVHFKSKHNVIEITFFFSWIYCTFRLIDIAFHLISNLLIRRMSIHSEMAYPYLYVLAFY